jgi:FPC/CPF motif-containing protein YcgG
MNPFSNAVAIANSSYSIFDGRELVRADTGDLASPLSHLVHDAVRALVLNDHFSCVGGKSSFRHGTYRFGLYSELGSANAAAGLARDLYTFVGEFPAFGDVFSTYVASFDRPNPPDEISFERDLWTTLQLLHDLDAPHHRWDPSVSGDPDDARFSFSFAGIAFFVIGLHAGSSRAARRFAWPTLVFNPHRQFERMRQDGDYARFQRVIRERDERLQGEPNPMVADFGTRSEAVQYSGRRVEGPWSCPFRNHAGHEGLPEREGHENQRIDDAAKD